MLQLQVEKLYHPRHPLLAESLKKVKAGKKGKGRREERRKEKGKRRKEKGERRKEKGRRRKGRLERRGRKQERRKEMKGKERGLPRASFSASSSP